MKKILLLLLIFPLTLFAQSTENKREKIKQLKIAFITAEIDLNSSESAKFWPLYNIADDKIFDIKKVRHAAYVKYIKNKKTEEITEAEAKKYVEITNDCERKILAIKEELNEELGNAVTYKKIVKLKYAEDKFLQKLIEQYKKK